MILSVVTLFSVAGGAYYLGRKSSFQKELPQPTNKPKQVSVSPTRTQETEQPLFSGKVKKIDTNLGLFKITDVDKENRIPDSIVYYEAGTFVRGEFAGYIRILAIRPSEGPGPSLQFILATKDYKSYLLDDPDNRTVNYPVDDWENPFTYIDKAKITKTVTLDTDHPKTISVASPFKLIRQNSVLLENKKTGQKSKEGYDIYVEIPITTFDTPLLPTSSQINLTLYTGGTDWSNSNPQNEKEKTTFATRNTYLNKTTLVHGMDSTGLTYSYLLSSKKEVDVYIKSSVVMWQQIAEYKKQVKLFNEGKLKEFPISPEFQSLPGMRFSKASVGLSTHFYEKYDSAFPGACGGNQSTYIVSSIQDSELQQIASRSEYPLFILKNEKHPLYKLAYEIKTDQGEESFQAVNKGKSIPTFEEYVAQHPLLFFKDAWGRWGVIGEFDLQLMGGCGKPVVYLYPQKTTAVHLSFSSLVELNTNIPTYHNGWLVNASPIGVLTDLQTQYTDCSKIDSAHFGSEYAAKACKTNSYPYIYWSGKSVENSYPKVSGGWVVEKKDLLAFMQNKLTEIGLTEKESSDMTSYWVPKMSEKNAPYYRIAFIQTKEMNQFIPMHVDPKPDSVLRVFLDWKALSDKPSVVPTPQRFEKLVRNGFTFVEWGGKQ